VHHRSDKAFYVLDGELEVSDGDQRRILTTGEVTFIPAGNGSRSGPIDPELFSPARAGQRLVLRKTMTGGRVRFRS
jgi:cupin domain